MAQWFWKKDLRLTEDKDDAWEMYEKTDSDRIEKAFSRGKLTAEVIDHTI